MEEEKLEINKADFMLCIFQHGQISYNGGKILWELLKMQIKKDKEEKEKES